MSVLGREISGKVVAGLAVIIVMAALLPALTTPAVREVRLVVKDMAFYLADDLEHPNPVIDVRSGESVRIVLENRDRGMTHDFAVPALSIETPLLKWNESGEMSFDAPASPGTYEYVCLPHQLMMRGTLRVLPGS